MHRHRANAERFDEIYRSHVDAVYAYARRRSSQQVAEEVTAETFLVCWRKLDRLPAEPLPWLYGVARKTLANARRADERQARARGAAADPALEEVGIAEDAALADAFASLGPADREVLALVAWEGLSLGEAAVTLGCSALACRVRFHRAKQRLAKRLAELEVDGDASRPVHRSHPEGVAP
jgi:RNA polymerase sigma-70 factor (ECF subfamily)